MGQEVCCCKKPTSSEQMVKVEQKPGKSDAYESQNFAARVQKNGLENEGLCLRREQGPVPLIVVSDPGQDLDDEMAYILMRYLTHLGMVDVRGIICTLCPALERARLARGTLDTLGFYDLPVAVGTDGGDLKGHHQASTFEHWADAYIPPPGSERCSHLEPARLLFFRVLRDAAPKSITVLIIAALKDPALFLRDNEELFVEKVKEVVIMGGVEEWDEKAQETVLVPDTAHNQEFDRAASEFLFKKCQELGIPLVVVSRWAAYAAKVPRNCYDELAAMGSSIGCRLRNAQRDSIESLWSRAARRPGDPQRQGLPVRCNADWFGKSFCGGSQECANRTPQDTIWDLIVGFMQYDSIALLCAIPELRNQYFEPISVRGPKSTQHQVIGKTEQEHGVLDPPKLVSFLDCGFRQGLAENNKRKVQFILLAQPLWNNITDELLSMAMLRALYSLGTITCVGIVVCRSVVGHEEPQTNHSSDGSRKSEGKDVDQFHKIKKTLQMLGLGNIRFFVDNYMSDQCVDDLLHLYQGVGPAGVCLVVTGRLGSALEFAKTHPKLFREKTTTVVHIGGANVVTVRSSSNSDGTSESGREILEPDPEAQSNQYDMDSARAFYTLLQDTLLVPMMIISRHAIKAVKVPIALFSCLDKHGGSKGKELYGEQRQSVETLWEAAVSPPGSQRRSVINAGAPLPDECNKSWYVSTFTRGKTPKVDGDIMNLHSHFYVYTSLAILACLTSFRKKALSPYTIPGRTVNHAIIGMDQEQTGIKDPDFVRSLFYQCFFKGVLQDSSEYSCNCDAAKIVLDEGINDSENAWRFDSSEYALQWLRD